MIYFAGSSGGLKSLLNQVMYSNNYDHNYTGPWQKSSLKNHMRLDCSVEPMFSCAICLRKFTRKSTLTYHLVSVHKTFKIRRKPKAINTRP